MPPAAKRRRITETATPKTLLPPSQRGIQAFGKISKSGNAAATTGKTNIRFETPVKPNQASTTSSPKKRKTAQNADDSPLLEEPPISLSNTSIDSIPLPEHRKPNVTSRARLPANPLTPKKSRHGRLAAPSFETSSSPSTITRSSSPLFDRCDTPPTSPLRSSTPEPEIEETNPIQLLDLPSELQDLIALHGSFLTALSIYYAHHGLSTPADLKLLTASTSQIWGKRSVTVEDVRRLVGIMQNIEEEGTVSQTSKFEIKNLGLGRVVLENSISAKPKRFTFKPFDDLSLRNSFQENICRQWTSYTQTNRAEEDVLEFLKILPLADVTISAAAMTSSANAQRRLEDLKTGAIKVLAKKPTDAGIGAEGNAPKAGSRGQSLLERVKAKQLHQSKLPPPPSKEKLLRKAALQHVEGITGVLIMLKSSESAVGLSVWSPGLQSHLKSAFTMASLVQKVKQSLRTPIGSEEVEACLWILSKELTPDWIKSEQISKLTCFIIHHDNQPKMSVLKEQVTNALDQTK